MKSYNRDLRTNYNPAHCHTSVTPITLDASQTGPTQTATPVWSVVAQQFVSRTLPILCAAFVVAVIGVCLTAAGIVTHEETFVKVEASVAQAKKTTKVNTGEGEIIPCDTMESHRTIVIVEDDDDYPHYPRYPYPYTPSKPSNPSKPAITPDPYPIDPVKPNSGFVIPDSSTRRLYESELGKYSDWQLYIARNEIYARHGRGFKKWNLRNYFEHCSWYTCLYDADYFDAYVEGRVMSDLERDNANTILNVEKARGSVYPYGNEYLQP